MFNGFYADKRVLVTGHTGFKGGWLSVWLKKLGAKVAGFATEPPTNPDLYSLVRQYAFDKEVIGDIRDFAKLTEAVRAFKPDIIFHLAAQPIVRTSYEQPVDTFTINTVGTINVLEAVRQLGLPSTLVLITTDKCYENREWNYAYRENDSLGGLDPYSASKAAAEIMIHSWRESFFRNSSQLGPVASARAGNVIGGGDYAKDRIIPDAVRAVLEGRELVVRNPGATRPWQHVLDSVHGYLLLGQKVTEKGGRSDVASAFNFGPGPQANLSVKTVIEQMQQTLPLKWSSPPQSGQPHEASKLNLTIDKAVSMLGWSPTWGFKQAVDETAAWYDQRHLKKNLDMLGFTMSQIEEFERSTESSAGASLHQKSRK